MLNATISALWSVQDTTAAARTGRNTAKAEAQKAPATETAAGALNQVMSGETKEPSPCLQKNSTCAFVLKNYKCYDPPE